MDPSLQVLAGGRDLVLPSQQEAARLARRMQRAFDKARPGGGGIEAEMAEYACCPMQPFLGEFQIPDSLTRSFCWIRYLSEVQSRFGSMQQVLLARAR